MPGPELLHLALELAPGSHPLHGRVRSAGRPDRSFSGWTELFAALEAAIRESRPSEESDQSLEGMPQC